MQPRMQCIAAYYGDFDKVRAVVTKENVNALYDGVTALWNACWPGSDDIVAWLIKRGADVNQASDWTPLYVASIYSYSRCIKLLLDAGADASIPTGNGCIPLHVAHESPTCVSLLIRSYPDGVYVMDEKGDTPLHSAAARGTLEACLLMLQAGSIVDAKNNQGHTPLLFAFVYDNRPVAELLIDRGANWDLEEAPTPKWVPSFIARRNACRASCYAMLELARRKSPVIGGNRRDVLRLIAALVWNTRLDKTWKDKNYKKKRV